MAKRKFTQEEVRQRRNESQREYSRNTNFAKQKEYNRTRGKNINFRIFTPQDDDIIRYLESLPNKAGYFKALIRSDMKERGIL